MHYKLIEEASGNEVKPGMTLIDNSNEMWKLVSFKSKPFPSIGRVTVRHVGKDYERDLYPSVFGLKIVESPVDKFDN